MTATTPLPLFAGVPGGVELLVVLAIAVLLFGADRIPRLANATGRALGEFEKGRAEVEAELTEADGTPDAEEGSDADHAG